MKKFLLASVMALLSVAPVSAQNLTEHQICIIVAESAYQSQIHQREGRSLQDVIEILQSNTTLDNYELFDMMVGVAEIVYRNYDETTPEMQVAVEAYNFCMDA